MTIEHLQLRDTVRLGWLTALQKPDGGVRGIVAGDVVRRLVARSMSQQMMEAVQGATTPVQYVLATRAGCECDMRCRGSQNSTHGQPVISMDGTSAFDLISRRAMMQGAPQCHTCLCFAERRQVKLELRSKLEKVEECRKFIARLERIIELDKARTREMASLAQARERLQRLEGEHFFRSGCTTTANDPATRLANQNGCSEGLLVPGVIPLAGPSLWICKMP